MDHHLHHHIDIGWVSYGIKGKRVSVRINISRQNMNGLYAFLLLALLHCDYLDGAVVYATVVRNSEFLVCNK